jgi:hypothetical protein
MARASCLTDDRPSPAPPKRDAMETLACENGRNRRLISASVRPIPLSETANATAIRPPVLRSGVTRSVTLPWSVNFTALSIRFSSAARRRTGSPTANAGSFSEISTDDARPLAAARPVRESPALRASVRRSKKSCRTCSPGPPLSRRIDEQRGKARQMFGAGLDGVDPAPLALIEVGGREQVADRQDAGERRADLMRKGGQARSRPCRVLRRRICACARVFAAARIRAFFAVDFLLAV